MAGRPAYGRAMTTPSETHNLAVVTGASHGIGLELARCFAQDGYDVLAVAEDDAIISAAAAIDASAPGHVEPLQIDLASDDGVDDLYDRIKAEGRPVEAIALNAGIGAGGAFVPGSHESGHDTLLSDELRLIDLNVRSTVHLAKHVLRDMQAQGHGRVLFTSSIASTMPGSYQAVYNASKSFVQSFALALRDELKDTEVTVTSLMPGPTDTEFFDRAGMQDTKVGQGDKDDPADVARAGYEAMQRGEERVVADSLKTKAQAAVSRVLPDAVKARMHENMAEPGSGE